MENFIFVTDGQCDSLGSCRSQKLEYVRKNPFLNLRKEQLWVSVSKLIPYTYNALVLTILCWTFYKLLCAVIVLESHNMLKKAMILMPYQTCRSSCIYSQPSTDNFQKREGRSCNQVIDVIRLSWWNSSELTQIMMIKSRSRRKL